MAKTSAHKRRRPFGAALSAVLALVLAPLALAGGAIAATPGGAAAATPGGTAAGGAPATVKPSSARATTKRTKKKAPKKPSPHILSIRITSVSCTPAANCDGNPHQVSRRGTLLVVGVGLKPGMVITFPRSPGVPPSAHISSVSPISRLRNTPAGLELTVPADAHSGHIMVLFSGGRYTSSYGPITVFAHALHPQAPKHAAPLPPAAPVNEPASASAFEGQGMWIWYVSKSDAGDTASIIAQAHAAGVSTLYIKSSDGPENFWSQFSPQLVAELHGAGLKVCAWQYVYGNEPAGEAQMGADAVANGADCLVIDAESEYEGRYAAAQTYIDDLRTKIGPAYPLGLASFPYVYYHPTLPYSVFLGPGGAQFNAPQMYWKDIGNSVDTVYADTYIDNRIYGRPIFPLGQTFESVSAAELVRFREEAGDYGAKGISFWDWQETSPAGWTALAAPLEPLTSVIPNPSYMELAEGRKGDAVLWMQEHLATAVPTQETTGIFSAATTLNVESFQTTHDIPVTGIVEAATWQALLALSPVEVDWTGGGPSD